MAVLSGTQEERTFDLGIEDGFYTLRIVEVEDVDGQFGPQVRVRFRVLDQTRADGEPIEFNEWYTIPRNQTTGEDEPVRIGTKFGTLFSAALFNGNPYAEGAELDTDDLVGKRVGALMGEYQTKARPGYPSRKKFGLLSVKAARDKKAAAPAAAAKVAPAGSLKKRLVDDDEDDDLADA